MIRSKLSILIFSLAVLTGSVFRIVDIVGKKTISHDEVISYLAATGHQGEYSYIVAGKRSPYGTWAQAHEWKRLISLEKRYCFKQIGSDLAHFDIHPPLYFWLLHLWSIIVGIHVWTGPSLNIIIALFMAFFLLRFALLTLGNYKEAVIVTSLWALSPAVISISYGARQYDLLALCTILFVGQSFKLLKSSENNKIREFILLGIFTTAGALTHFHFFLIVMGCCIFLIVKLIRLNWRLLFTTLISICTGYLAFFLLSPDFYRSILFQREISLAFDLSDFIPRIIFVFGNLFSFFIPEFVLILLLPIILSIAPFVIMVLIILILWILIKYAKKHERLISPIKKPEFTGIQVLYFLIWISGITILLYLLQVSPRHAMSARHWSMVWPFYAFIPVFIIRFLKRFKTHLVVSLYILLLLGNFGVLYNQHRIYKDVDPTVLLKNSNRIIVDSLLRGYFPRIFWHVPDDKLIFAASQHDMLDNPKLWLSPIDDAVYISLLAKEQHQHILKLIRQDYEVIPVEGGIWGIGEVFRVQKKVK